MLDQHAIFITHGVLASLAWVVFFPLGSVLIRTLNGPSTWKVHAYIQLFAMTTFTAAVGTGLQMATRFRLLSNFHAIIGLTIFSLMFIQAVTGYVHHAQFKRHHRRTVSSHVHLWLGRGLITAGMINGGLGLWINDRVRSYQIVAYGVVAGVFWSGWVTVSAVAALHRHRHRDIKVLEPTMSYRAERARERRARAQMARKERWMRDSM